MRPCVQPDRIPPNVEANSMRRRDRRQWLQRAWQGVGEGCRHSMLFASIRQALPVYPDHAPSACWRKAPQSDCRYRPESGFLPCFGEGKSGWNLWNIDGEYPAARPKLRLLLGFALPVD